MGLKAAETRLMTARPHRIYSVRSGSFLFLRVKGSQHFQKVLEEYEVRSVNCIALILAGGAGTRLGVLTKIIAKPAIPFGGKYRLIDFSLSNCCNSGIDSIGVLTPPSPFSLQDKIMGANACKIYVLPPNSGSRVPYKGTADAVYQNIKFVDQWNPACVIILSGDHIYRMDYRPFLAFHRDKKADVTIAGIEVPWDEAYRFGIFTTREDQSIATFIEKPVRPDNNLASMGVYIFSWPYLKKILEQDAADLQSAHDFGKNIIPKILTSGGQSYAYLFTDYWRDVGTIQSFYDAHMDLLGKPPLFDLNDNRWPLYTSCPNTLSHVQIFFDHIRNSLISSCSVINGAVRDSVIFPGTRIGRGAYVSRSVIMTGAYVGAGQYLDCALLCPCALSNKEDVIETNDFSPKVKIIRTADLGKFKAVLSIRT